MNRQCKLCGVTADLSFFEKDKNYRFGRTYRCKRCVAEKARRYRDENLESCKARSNDWKKANQRAYRLRHYDKYIARNKLNNAIRDGKVKRGKCFVCGSLDAHGHHTDYSKPLDVVWLCSEHHGCVHAETLPE